MTVILEAPSKVGKPNRPPGGVKCSDPYGPAGVGGNPDRLTAHSNEGQPQTPASESNRKQDVCSRAEEEGGGRCLVRGSAPQAYRQVNTNILNKAGACRNRLHPQKGRAQQRPDSPVSRSAGWLCSLPYRDSPGVRP